MLRKIGALFFASLLLLCALSGCAQTGQPQEEVSDNSFSLCTDGVTDYKIVIAKDASRNVWRAATDFRQYLRMATGAEFTLVYDDTEATEHEIVLGATARDCGETVDFDALGKDGFIIRNVGEKLFILSDEDSGVRYGTFAFLEEYVGVRFLAKDMDHVPSVPTLKVVPFEEDNVQVPVFSLRHNSNAGYDEASLRWREKLHFNQGDTTILKGITFTDIGGAHSFSTLMGWTLTEGYRKQPCLTDEANIELMRKNLFLSLERSGENAEIVSLSQNDSPLGQFGNCKCDTCLEQIETYGYSGYVLLFVNRLAREVKEKYPDMLVHTFAYYDTIDPPKGGIVPEDNVVIQFCNAGGCMMHSYTSEDPNIDSLYPNNTRHFYECLKAWCEISEHVIVWDYNTNFGSTLSSIPNFDRLYELVQVYREVGVDGVFMQGMSNIGEFDNLRAYLVGKLLWNPDITYEEYRALMREYLDLYYGPGGEHILEYIDAYAEMCDKTHIAMYHDTYRFITPTTKTDENGKTVYDSTKVDALRAYWEQALAKAETARQKDNLRRSMLPVYYMEVIGRLQLQSKTGEDFSRIVELNTIIFDTMQEFGIAAYKEGFSITGEPNLKNSIHYWAFSGGDGIYDEAGKKRAEEALAESEREPENDGVIDVTQGLDAAEDAEKN